MLPIPVGRPVLVGGPPIMNMAALASSLFKAFRGSKWARALADKLNLKPGFLRCTVLGADPVDMITGEVVMQQHDFTVSGRLPLVWDGITRVTICGAARLAMGWQTPADIRLELMRHEGSVGVAAYFPGHATAFDAMPDAAGWPARVYDWQHGHALYRQDDCLLLRTRAGIEYAFALPAHWQYALERLADDATLLTRSSDAWLTATAMRGYSSADWTAVWRVLSSGKGTRRPGARSNARRLRAAGREPCGSAYFLDADRFRRPRSSARWLRI
ncbi:DUF6531 domain-containing protein [Burkholderia pseudomallei]